MITIYEPQIETNESKTRLKCRIKDDAQSIDEELWYEVDNVYANYLCPEICDGFIIAMLLPAIKFKQNIEVKAPMTASLYYNLVNVVIPLMAKLYSYDLSIEECSRFLTVRETVNTDFHPSAIATGCSMGVDSLTAIKQHLELSNNGSYKLTHFSYFNVGAFGSSYNENTELTLNREKQEVLAFAAKLGLPTVIVNSNIHNWYSTFKNFNHSHTLRNMSVVLCLQKLFKNYFYASGYPIVDFRLTKDLAHFETLLLPQISTHCTSLISANANYNRIEKLRYIGDDPLAIKNLYVCLKDQIWNDRHVGTLEDDSFRNCGKCEKCLRTLVILDTLGIIENYRDIFNVDYYYRAKITFIKAMYALRHENDTYRDILRYNPSLIKMGGGKMVIKDFINCIVGKEKYIKRMRFISTHMYMFVK